MKEIIVDIDGTLVRAVDTDGRIRIESDNKDYVSAAQSAAYRGVEVPLISGMPYVTFRAGEDSDLGLTAALVAVDPGHARIVQTTDEVNEILRNRNSVNGVVTVIKL